jgi:phosphatidate cytidylyltransferase
MPLLLLCMYSGGIPFVILIAVIIVFGQREFYCMAMENGYDAQPWLGQILGLILFASMLWSGTRLFGPELSATALVFTVIIGSAFIREMFAVDLRYSILRISITLLGIFFVSWSFGHLCLLRELRPWGREYTYFLFIIVWTVDSAAYAVGSRFGRYKLVPNVSPGKTIEGTVGGIIAGLLAGLMLQPLMMSRFLNPLDTMILALGIGICAQISDISESVMKRAFGVKDSSVLLPGLGGILDRFDSFILTAPLLYYYILLK